MLLRGMVKSAISSVEEIAVIGGTNTRSAFETFSLFRTHTSRLELLITSVKLWWMSCMIPLIRPKTVSKFCRIVAESARDGLIRDCCLISLNRRHYFFWQVYLDEQ